MLALVLYGLVPELNAQTLDASWNSPSEVAVTADSYTATGKVVHFTLNFQPAPGSVLTVVRNTGAAFITGRFENLAQGQKVALTFAGQRYNFTAHYYGETGNDLVLMWAGLAVQTWGRRSFYPQEHVLPFAQIVAGGSHTLALKRDGTVVAWGYNRYGQTSVPAGLNGVTAIAAGWRHTVALRSDGTVVAWGQNQYGQTRVPAGLTGVRAIAAGGYSTMALKHDGTVVAWGENSSGQVTVPAGLTGVIAIAVSQVQGAGGHAVALKSDGTVVAWGSNFYGQTTVPDGLSGVTAIAATTDTTIALEADGTVTLWGRRTTIPAGLSGVMAISSGVSHTVALRGNGTVVAWGSNDYGESRVPAGLSGVTAISAGGFHSIALKADGTVVQWGDIFDGQGAVPAGLIGLQSVAVSGDGTYSGGHTIALKSDGTVAVWGNNSHGQTTVPQGLAGVAGIAAGEFHTAALQQDGRVVIWGSEVRTFVGATAIAAGHSHTAALRGDGTVSAWNNGAMAVPAGLSGVMAIAAGGSYTLALKSNGSVVEWDTSLSPTTVPAGLNGVTAIAAGEFHRVALKNDGTVVGWGENSKGQTTVPAGLNEVIAIAAGDTHTVALKRDGTVVAWGDNGFSQTTVPAGLTGVAAIAAGGDCNAALVPLRPYLQPGSVSQITPEQAAIQVQANPNGQPATLTLRYGTDTSYGNSVSLPLPVDDSTVFQTASTMLTGLSIGTLYHYRLEAQSPSGLTIGQDQTFSTPLELPPAAAWRLHYFGTPDSAGPAADLADPDADGLPNLIEYALGSDPGASSPPLAAGIVPTPGGLYLQLNFTRDPARSDATIEVQAADSPAGPWDVIASSVLGGVTSGPGYIGGDDATPGTKTVEVRDIVTAGDPAHPRRFLRLRVVR